MPAKPAVVAGGAETGAVKQGSTETRPLSPGTSPATPNAPTPGATPLPSVIAPIPLKSGAKAVKRPYSDTVLAEVKGADAAIAPTPSAAPATTAPATTAPAATAPATPPPATTSSGGTAAASGSSTPSAATAATAATKPAAGSPTFAWPIKGKVLAGFSEPKQMGLILDGKLGEPISAAGDGKVIFSGPGPRGYGNLIIVKHEGELLSVYAHNKTLLVKDQESVKKGQKIAELGESGTDSPKLHFEIRRQGKPVDPKQYLPAR
jgi:lipoprotein NlpD